MLEPVCGRPTTRSPHQSGDAARPQMACLLLFHLMQFDFVKKRAGPFFCVLFGLLSVMAVSHDAAGQTGATPAQRTIDALVESNRAGPPSTLQNIESQPQLERHIRKINQIRLLLNEQKVESNMHLNGLEQDTAVGTLYSPVVPPFVPPVIPPVIPRHEKITGEGDEATLAILELETSIAARRGPSTFYPGAGIVLALTQISNLSERNMIKALNSGGKPIYSDMGHLIGVEDPISGLLLGGRRR